jgi:hypothetical protein
MGRDAAGLLADVWAGGVTNADKPIYLVAFRDQWVTISGVPLRDGEIIAFQTREAAQLFASNAAVEKDLPVSLYRIVEYRFSGNVSEG